MLTSFTVWTALWLSASGAASAAAPVHEKSGAAPFRVQLKISAENDLAAPVRKALEDSLKALPDVQVSEPPADYVISVIVLKVVNQSRRDVGVTFSVLVTTPYVDRVRTFAETHVPAEAREQLVTMLSDAVKPLAHWIQTAALADLAAVCRNIVDTFDKEVLAPLRRSPADVSPRTGDPVKSRLP